MHGWMPQDDFSGSADDSRLFSKLQRQCQFLMTLMITISVVCGKGQDGRFYRSEIEARLAKAPAEVKS